MKNTSSIFYYNYSTCSATEELAKRRLSKHKTRLPLWRDYLDLVCVHFSFLWLRYCDRLFPVGLFVNNGYSISGVSFHSCARFGHCPRPPPPYFR
jgi:hypothetical protein